jgi:hypothetical protein
LVIAGASVDTLNRGCDDAFVDGILRVVLVAFALEGVSTVGAR